MKRYISIVAAVVIAAFTLEAQNIPDYLQKLLNAQYAVSNFYVDTVNNNKLVEDAIHHFQAVATTSHHGVVVVLCVARPVGRDGMAVGIA